MSKETSVDFTVDNQGTLFILRGVSDAAKEWIKEHVQAEDYQRWCGGIAIEHRYIQDIYLGLIDAGFSGEITR